MSASAWRTEEDGLVRELLFRDFPEAVRFVDLLCEGANDYGRRPDVAIRSGHVRLSVENRHNAGITMAEERLAAKVDAVVDALGSRPTEIGDA